MSGIIEMPLLARKVVKRLPSRLLFAVRLLTWHLGGIGCWAVCFLGPLVANALFRCNCQPTLAIPGEIEPTLRKKSAKWLPPQRDFSDETFSNCLLSWDRGRRLIVSGIDTAIPKAQETQVCGKPYRALKLLPYGPGATQL